MEGQQNEALEQRQNCCCLTGHRSLPSDPDRLAELPMGPNVAGVIGSAVAAGILINIFG